MDASRRLNPSTKLDASRRLNTSSKLDASRRIDISRRMDASREVDKNDQKVMKSLKFAEMKAYQQLYMLHGLEKESRIVREKAESKLDDLVDYVNHLSEENERLKDYLLELSELKMRKQANEQAKLLNGLTNSKDVSAKLDNLRSKLSSSQNLLKGVSDSSANNFTVDVEELNATVEIMEQFKNISFNEQGVTSEWARDAAKLADMAKEEVEMAQEISTLLKEVEHLAIEKNYLATTINLRENNS